jgi:hypothetical protein
LAARRMPTPFAPITSVTARNALTERSTQNDPEMHR